MLVSLDKVGSRVEESMSVRFSRSSVHILSSNFTSRLNPRPYKVQTYLFMITGVVIFGTCLTPISHFHVFLLRLTVQQQSFDIFLRYFAPTSLPKQNCNPKFQTCPTDTVERTCHQFPNLRFPNYLGILQVIRAHPGTSVLV